ncbi:MAG: ParB/RepB/Spo0J family partition protein [Coriobacteriales bacterium]|nr:ParB/RepB/Spo0J family partition protein [Coriobacteriales bacterium]
MARKGGLGRGLESLLGETAGEVGESPADAELPVDQIHPNPDQPRKHFDEDALNELADSIRQNGLLQPILVRKDRDGCEIVAGERRYQAARRAGLQSVPVTIRDISDEDVLKLALIENLQRTDLNPMEAARGYQLLMEQNGLTQEELASILSKSRSAVANAMRLLALPERVQEYVRDGELSSGHARAILSVPDDEGRIRLAERVIAEGLSVRQTETLAPLFSVGPQAEPAPKQKRQVPQTFQTAAKRLGSALNTKVRVRQVRGKNRIEIEFASEEELAQLVNRLDGTNDFAGSDEE